MVDAFIDDTMVYHFLIRLDDVVVQSWLIDRLILEWCLLVVIGWYTFDDLYIYIYILVINDWLKQTYRLVDGNDVLVIAG